MTVVGVISGFRTARAALIGVFALIAVSSAPAAAQPVTTNEAVARLFQQEIQADWFDDAFLAQVSVAQLSALVGALTSQFGALVEVAGEGGQLTTRLEQATMATQVVLDADGRIAGLFFGTPIPVGANLDDLIAQIVALPGQTSVLVMTNGAVVAQHQADTPLAVGSAFKLAVLAALTDEVAAGRLAWDDVVPFDPAWRSLPTGILQDWPEGTPLTLATLANLMISISDNTAADALIDIVGREKVEAESPRNTPFPTTGELFRLKSHGNEDAAAAWKAGDTAARRDVLAGLADVPLPTVDQLLPEPDLDIEWYFSATEICALLEHVGGNPAFAINPGLADPGNWAHIAFKGGSEAGVLNLSTLVTGADGTTHCVVATWNNTAVLDDQVLFTPYAGLLAALARTSASESDASGDAYDDGTIVVPVPADFTLATTPDEVTVQAVIPPCDAGFDACIFFSGDTYDGTNFESAGVRVSKRADLATADACLNTQPSGYQGLVPTTVEASGYATSLFTGLGDAGAGHYATGELYRLAVGGACYEFETRIGQTQFANYDPGTIEEFTADDEAALNAALRAIVAGVTVSGEAVQFPAP